MVFYPAGFYRRGLVKVICSSVKNKVRGPEKLFFQFWKISVETQSNLPSSAGNSFSHCADVILAVFYSGYYGDCVFWWEE